MRVFFAISALLALGLTALAAAGPVTTGPALGLHLRRCTQGRNKTPAMCGTFGVYENRAAGTGRIIQLGVVVLKAPHPTADPIAFIEGGPGVAAVPDAPYIADGDDPVLAAVKANRDIFFVDARGMGTSNPTKCNISPYGNMPAYFLQIWPDAILSACYLRYSAHSDPSAYNTDNAVDDLDDVRAALGYQKIVLYGGSYGSFFSFVYIRRHQAHVRSAALEGIIAPHYESLPGAPDGAQTAFDDLAAKCGRDATCRSTFPQFVPHFYAVLRRFANGPVAITVRNPKTKRWVEVRLSKEVLVDRIRENLYAPQTAAYLPYIVERAYRGDYAPLGRLVDLWSQFLAQGQDAGTNLGYRCADLDPFISDAELEEQAAHSFTGDLRVVAERHACEIWKVAPMPPSFNDPVRSTVPILMVNGSDDPVTPPKYATAALANLPNGRLVLVRGAGHGVDTPCTDRAMIRFLRNASVEGIDSDACVASFKPPPFATSMAKWQDY
ncbi:MAG TPA: alpha/beta hydrolase [Candidatus Acidoferrales bacterium]|nr:alpha/beta hydrolase [Candidatus Acidoferrales bacterium]